MSEIKYILIDGKNVKFLDKGKKIIKTMSLEELNASWIFAYLKACGSDYER